MRWMLAFISVGNGITQGVEPARGKRGSCAGLRGMGLEEFSVKGIGKSGRPKCNIITDKANMGKVYKPRGGNLHGFWVNRVGEFYKKQGGTVEYGDSTSGKEMDIAVELDGKIGVEVVIESLVADNLSTHTKYYNQILILVIDDKKKREIEKHIGKLGSQVEVDLLKNYFIKL